MVATLQSRKEALEAKILEKNEELKKLCLQEADLTGVIPPEIPLEPGEPPPPIRRRVGTSFSFPQNLINNVNDADDDAVTALELECKVQTNIAEAALALANDASANKAARRKHRLMYRQSQRRLMELESRLNLLKQGKAQPLKLHQIKKKPRPNTTAVENLSFLWNKTNDNQNQNLSGSHMGLWSSKLKTDYSSDDVDGSRDFLPQSDGFGSLHRSFKSSATSQSSGSPRTDIENDEFKPGINLNNSFTNHFVSGYLSQPNIPDVEAFRLNLSSKTQYHKKNGKPIVRKQWDTQSAGGMLLPSQTYPDHSHQPNLSRTQSLGSVESNPQKPKDSWSMQDFSYEGNASKEKEWYETSLDSAPSPPLRTTSRLPPTARLLYQMQENHFRDISNWGGNVSNLQPSNSHPALPTTPNAIHRNVTRSASAYPASENTNLGIDNLTNYVQQMNLNPNLKAGNINIYHEESGILNQNELFLDYENAENKPSFEYSASIPKLNTEGVHYQADVKPKMESLNPNNSNDSAFLPNCDSHSGLLLVRQNSLNQTKYKSNSGNELDVKKLEDNLKQNNSIYVNIPEDNSNSQVNNWMTDEEFVSQRIGSQIAVPQEYVPKTQTPTQPYYHALKNSPGEKIKNLQYQAARNRHASVAEELGNTYQLPSPVQRIMHHPPHAITQNEISFDTVVPFESPQNHTVVQAGKWQPYREVTKPFEMSDFYKYSTKFRQNKAAQGNRTATPDVLRNSPNTQHQKGIYTPLKPMTCRPVESRNNQILVSNQGDVQCDDEKTLVEVSPPEIVLSNTGKWKMQLFQWNALRRFSGYVKVRRPDSFKIVERPANENMSVSKLLHLKIQSSGPLTVAEYMRTALTNPLIGYYIQKDIIGRKGDFITSPEISQIFSEIIAVWVYHEYKKIGAPKPWQIIELGPGKGTLMKGILRVLSALKACEDLSVHMVEVSPIHAKIQLQSLCDDSISFGVLPRRTKENPFYKSSTTVQDVPIYWYEKLEEVPKGFSVILAHEFFDALPIHKFQKVPEGWREVLINSTEVGKEKFNFSYVLSKEETTMSKLLIRKNETREHVEVCPEGMRLARYIAERLEETGGFGLFIDYGHDGEKTDTFRAFKSHELSDPLINPGSKDLTADVDFSYLKEVMKDKMLIYGPTEQGDFLNRMGIQIRLDMVLKNAEEDAEAINSACQMIVDKNQMGSRYKCFAVFPSVLEEFRKPYLVEGFYDSNNSSK